MKSVKRLFLHNVVTVLILFTFIPTHSAQAAMLSTKDALHSRNHESNSLQLNIQNSRKKLQQELISLGISKNVSDTRVENLTDSEVKALIENIGDTQSAPGGQMAQFFYVVGVTVVVIAVTSALLIVASGG